MSDKSQIDALLEQVQALRDQVQPADRDGEFKQMEHDRARAVAERNAMQRERDAARAELAKVKADVGWTMGKLLIRDIMYMKGVEIDCSGEGWLPLNQDPKDTERIEWINAHGRVGAGEAHWLISLPHHLTLNEELPQPYNVRHIIDLARATALGGKP